MAKSKKTTTPSINPPNGGMLAWLQQNNPVASVLTSDSAAPKEELAPEQVEHSKPVMPAEKQASSTSESKEDLPNKDESQLKEADVIIIGEETTTNVEASENNTADPTPRKPKIRVGEGIKSSSTYLETFFKKPVKASGVTSLAVEGKPIRVSEESHSLLSVLVSEARRQGFKLNVGDLIDNLLTHHRSVHKSEVDELIAKWKSRKSFD